MATINQVSRVILKKVLAVETPEVCPWRATAAVAWLSHYL